mmetsp:Transcript_39184/g.63589  ORF Transcript_39184/g.63589 Transcript_39184/m.63589 type:complete len:190 (+) Transcript_39184:6661-7230(+)
MSILEFVNEVDELVGGDGLKYDLVGGARGTWLSCEDGSDTPVDLEQSMVKALNGFDGTRDLEEFFDKSKLKRPGRWMYAVSLLDKTLGSNDSLVKAFVAFFLKTLECRSEYLVGGYGNGGLLRVLAICVINDDQETICKRVKHVMEADVTTKWIYNHSRCNGWLFHLLKLDAANCNCKTVCSRFLKLLL